MVVGVYDAKMDTFIPNEVIHRSTENIWETKGFMLFWIKSSFQTAQSLHTNRVAMQLFIILAEIKDEKIIGVLYKRLRNTKESLIKLEERAKLIRKTV